MVRVGSSVQDVVSEWKACSGCDKRALYIVQCWVRQRCAFSGCGKSGKSGKHCLWCGKRLLHIVQDVVREWYPF